MKQLLLVIILMLGSVTAAQAMVTNQPVTVSPNIATLATLAYYPGPWCGNRPCYYYRYYYQPAYYSCRWIRQCYWSYGYYHCGWVRRCW